MKPKWHIEDTENILMSEANKYKAKKLLELGFVKTYSQYNEYYIPDSEILCAYSSLYIGWKWWHFTDERSRSLSLEEVIALAPESFKDVLIYNLELFQ